MAGEATGRATVLSEPLSFWGGMDPASGELIDTHHPERGAILTGRVLVMPMGRGSSSSASVLAEAIRVGTAPAAIVLREPDGIVALGAIVARELYGARVPVVVVDAQGYERIADGATLRIVAGEDGAVVDHVEGA